MAISSFQLRLYTSFFRWCAFLLTTGLAATLAAGCAAPAAAGGAPLTHLFTRAQVLADPTQLQRLKEAAHAGLYKYPQEIVLFK